MSRLPRPLLVGLAVVAVAFATPAGRAWARSQELPSDQVRVPEATGSVSSAARATASASASMAAATDIPFSRSVAYTVGSQPRSVTAADLNGDGYPDLIVPSNGSNTTLILYGTPDGRYDSSPRATLVSPASNGQKAVVGDFNNDGLPDIAVVGFFDGISIWYQNPDHSFGGGGSPNTRLGVSGNFNSGLAAGDLNGDGVPDLVAPSQSNGLVRVWLSLGPIGWQFGGDYSASAFNSDWVELADVNGDGHLDAIVTDDAPYDRVSVLYGTGNGGPFGFPSAFSSTQTFAVGSGPNTCTVADVNADGRPDILVASWNGVSSFTTMLNQGGGAFAISINSTADLLRGDCFAIAAGDVDGDGKIDALIANGVSGTLSIFPGNGNGTFGPDRLVGIGSAARGIALTDLNGDGRLDVATSNLNANTVQVLLNGPSDIYPGAVFPAGNDTQLTFNITDRTIPSVAAGDFNRDGHLDLATVHPAAGTISVLMGAGNGTYGPPTAIPVGSQPQAVVAADFDRDGVMDLAVANKANGTVSVLYGKGDGTFKSKINLGADAGTSDVIVADVNGDGRPDLVTANADGNTISVLLKNAGGGGFKDRINAAAGIDPRGVALGDLNGDGKLDAVVADSAGGGISVLFGTGDGHFTLQYSAGLWGPGPTAVALADLDHDGYLDVVLSDTGHNAVRILRGNGTGIFPFGTSFESIPEPRRVTVADIDGDGWFEVLVGARLGQTYILYPFEPSPPRGQRSWAVGSASGAVLAFDANEDGATDLVAMDPRVEKVCVLLNQNGGGASLAASKPSLGGASLEAAIARVSVSPNPMNPAATLKFTLGAPGPLHVRLFDARGRLVRTLADESQAAAGERRIWFSGQDDHGSPLSTGVYFYKIETARGATTGRVTVLK